MSVSLASSPDDFVASTSRDWFLDSCARERKAEHRCRDFPLREQSSMPNCRRCRGSSSRSLDEREEVLRFRDDRVQRRTLKQCYHPRPVCLPLPPRPKVISSYPRDRAILPTSGLFDRAKQQQQQQQQQLIKMLGALSNGKYTYCQARHDAIIFLSVRPSLDYIYLGDIRLVHSGMDERQTWRREKKTKRSLPDRCLPVVLTERGFFLKVRLPPTERDGTV